jgi:hypothetical protein
MLHPNIPCTDTKQGRGRVGTSSLNLASRVQLAVNAHIRHDYTDYDKLLRVMPWADARKAVTNACVKKLKEWRGEDGQDYVEEKFEEWIDLRDDDDDDSNAESYDSTDRDDAHVNTYHMPILHESSMEDSTTARRTHHRFPSVEVISMRPRVNIHGEQQHEILPSVERSPPNHYALRQPPAYDSPKVYPFQFQPANHSHHYQNSHSERTGLLQHDNSQLAGAYSSRNDGHLTTGAKNIQVIDLTSSPRALRYVNAPRSGPYRHSFPDQSRVSDLSRPDAALPLIQGLRGGNDMAPQWVTPASTEPGYAARDYRSGPHRRVLSGGLAANAAHRDKSAPAHHTFNRSGPANYVVPEFGNVGVLGTTHAGQQAKSRAIDLHRSIPSPPHPDVPTTGWVQFKNHR